MRHVPRSPALSRAALRLSAAALLAFVPAAAAAQDAAMPAASELLAKHIAAMGGEAAIRKHTSTKMTGSFEMPAAGLTGTLTTVSAAPNKMLLRIEVGGMGEIVTGFDGTHGWSVNPMQGARLHEGAELAAQKEGSDYYGSLGMQAAVASRTTVGKTEMGGVPCWEVKVQWKSGRESTECYAVESGLLVANKARIETPQGTIDQVTLIGDYKDFGGVKVPTVMRLQAMGMEQVMRVTSVEYGTVTPADLEPPAAIQALIKAKAGGEQ